MKKTGILGIVIILLIAAGSMQAANRLVPGEYSTIQAGIDAAVNGDTVIVDPNTYTGVGNRDIDFKGKKITVRSTDPNDPNVVAATIIDCQGSSTSQHRGFYFHSGEDANSVLSGFTITNGLIDDGGGIYCHNSGPAITNCNISGNQAYYWGGGIDWSSSDPYPSKLIIANCIINNNTAIVGGGGVDSFARSLTLINCTISKNTSYHSRAAISIYCNGGNLTLVRCTIVGNKVTRGDFFDGSGAIGNFNGGNLDIMQCTINDNSAGNCYSGGIYWIGGTLKISDSAINGNTASYYGGGIYNHSIRQGEITRCTISGNFAKYGGGGICCIGPLKITDSTISGNETGGSGGGISNNDIGYGVDALDIARCTIKDNSTASGSGGGIYWDSALKITDSTISGNKARSAGGINVRTRSSKETVEIINCIIAGNSATRWGGGIRFSGNNNRIVNSAIVQNKGGELGGGISYEIQLAVENCILWANEAISGPGICLLFGNFDFLSVGFSDLQGGKDSISGYNGYVGGTVDWGPGNIDADPCFVEFGYWSDPNNTPADANDDIWVEGDYHLLETSPCINAGDPNYVPEPNETDLDGLPRIIGGRIDMGAYEFNHIPIADAGPDQTVYADSNCTAKITLDGSTSYDPDGDKLSYIWKLDGQVITTSGRDDIINFADFAALAEKWSSNEKSFTELALLTSAWLSTPNSPNWNPQCDLASASPSAGAITTVNLPLGEHHIQLIVNDGRVDSQPDETVVTVLDNTPPQFTLSVEPTILWPPNHQMVRVTPSWIVTDNCTQSPQVSLVSITSNEPDNGNGDGNTTGDVQITDDGSIYLRAERSGTGSGRIYSITYQAVDDADNTAESSAVVTVPHDQRTAK